MTKEQIQGNSGEIRQLSGRRKKAPQSAATPTSRQLEFNLPIVDPSREEQPDRGVVHAYPVAHQNAPTVSRVTGLLDPSREKHRNAIVASRDELIGELSAYLRTDLKTLLDPDMREFTLEEEAQFNAWIEDLSDEQLNDEIELCGEKLAETIQKLANQRR